MDLNEESSGFIGQSRQAFSVDAGVTVGCNLALLIAFNHLKKKFAAQSAELKKLRGGNMNSDQLEECNSTTILERKVDQLQRSLQNKITAYNNLEETFKQTRENEEAMIKHTSETEQFLLETMGKTIAYQKENNELKEKVEELTKQVNKLETEKKELNHELLEIKSIPEVSISKSLPNYPTEEVASPRVSSEEQPNSQKHLKQIEALLYENKTLKTNMYWLVTELKSVKKKEGLTSPRIRLDSGGLEEGRASQIMSKEDGSNVCPCFKKILAYTRKLERTITTLKGVIDKNNTIINNLLLKKYGRVPRILRRNDSLGSCKLTESYVTISNEEEDSEFESSGEAKVLWDVTHEDDVYNLPELESASVIVPLDELTSDDETDYSCNNSGHLQGLLMNIDQNRATSEDTVKCDEVNGFTQQNNGDSSNHLADPNKDEEKPHDPFNDSYGESAFRKFNRPCDLPLSLLHNLELQQTKTYLTSKKSNENTGSDSRLNSPRCTNCTIETKKDDQGISPGNTKCVEFT